MFGALVVRRERPEPAKSAMMGVLYRQELPAAPNRRLDCAAQDSSVLPNVFMDLECYAGKLQHCGLDPVPVGQSALEHWEQVGREHRIVPTPLFDEGYYIADNGDVAEQVMFGFAHYITYGLKEGRRPTWLFDPAWYAARHGVGLGGDADYVHFLTDGIDAGAMPSPHVEHVVAMAGRGARLSLALFGRMVAACARWSDVLEPETLQLLASLYVADQGRLGPSVNPLQGFVDLIEAQLDGDASPGPLFDVAVYRLRAFDRGLQPIPPGQAVIHWLRFGRQNRVVPTELFNEDYYYQVNPDIAGQGIFGYEHYVRYGVLEGRRPAVLFDPDYYWARLRPSHLTLPSYLDFLTRGLAAQEMPSAFVEQLLAWLCPGTALSLPLYARMVAPLCQWAGVLHPAALQMLGWLYIPAWHGQEAQENPCLAFLHYLETGAQADVPPGPLFDPLVYRQRAGATMLPPVPPGRALEHWLAHGYAARIVPTARYDEAFYMRANPDLVTLPGWGFEHFVAHGVAEGRRATAGPSGVDFVWLERPYRDGSLRRPLRKWLAEDRAAGSGRDDTETDAPAMAVARARALTNSRRFSEIMRRAQAIEPAVGDVDAITTMLKAPYHSQLARCDEQIRDRLQRSHYDTIICVPWIREGGADLVAGILAHSLLRIRPDESVLILRCDNPHFERADWLPAQADTLDISDITTALGGPEGEVFLRSLLLGLTPDRVINVNSRLCWSTFQRLGATIAYSMDLYGYFFCWDQTPSGRRVGYPAQYFCDTLVHMRAFFTDTEYLKNELAEMYMLPQADQDKLVPLFTPVGAAATFPVIARQAVASASAGRRPTVLWAGRLDRQKRFDLVQDIARLMPEVSFRCWGAALLDAPPDLSGLPCNVSMHGRFHSMDDLPLAQADAWLFTAAWEGMPTILIHLAMRGVAVVASAVGGVPELIREDTGWPLQPMATASEYAAALRSVLAAPDQAVQRAEALQKLAASKYAHAVYDADLARVLARSGAR